MTLEDLLNIRVQKQQQLEHCAIEYNKANTIRREIEAKYVIEGKSKPKAEALFIVEHADEWKNYQRRKQNFIYAESQEKQASKIYYQARNGQDRGDLVDSAISQLVNDNFIG